MKNSAGLFLAKQRGDSREISEVEVRTRERANMPTREKLCGGAQQIIADETTGAGYPDQRTLPVLNIRHGLAAELQALVGFEHGFKVWPIGFIHVIEGVE